MYYTHTMFAYIKMVFELVEQTSILFAYSSSSAISYAVSYAVSYVFFRQESSRKKAGLSGIH